MTCELRLATRFVSRMTSPQGVPRSDRVRPSGDQSTTAQSSHKGIGGPPCAATATLCRRGSSSLNATTDPSRLIRALKTGRCVSSFSSHPTWNCAVGGCRESQGVRGGSYNGQLPWLILPIVFVSDRNKGMFDLFEQRATNLSIRSSCGHSMFRHTATGF
jgi:hypothetical protein